MVFKSQSLAFWRPTWTYSQLYSLMNLVHFPLYLPLVGFASKGSVPCTLTWTLSNLPIHLPMKYALAGIATVAIMMVRLSQPERPNLNAFPTIDAGGWFHSWWAGIKYMTNSAGLIHEGYKKYGGAPFKIATLCHWVVIITSRVHVEELRSAREEEISFLDAANEDFSFDFTFGSEVQRNPHHLTVIRSHLTRNIGVLCPELREEAITAFEETLDLQDNEWKSVPALPTIQRIVCRTSNRVFVGLPLCRDPDFVTLNLQFTSDVVLGGLSIAFFPKFLKPLAARFITNISKNIQRGAWHLRPIIEERRKHLNEYGKDWTDIPNDLLSWLMSEAGPTATVEFLTNLMLVTNFAAIHTTANVFTFALYNLAANPHFAEPLREEVETIVEKEGWSKTSLAEMRKIDSFLKESIRMENVSTLSMTRKAAKDFRFSDGTLIPKGTRINAGMIAVHYDDTLYENAEVFDPFRFSRMSEANETDTKHQFVTTAPEYLTFGHGRFACPGRFFAATELKVMLAHVVTKYDVKLEKNMPRPPSVYIGSSVLPNATAKVMFRKRRARGDGGEC